MLARRISYHHYYTDQPPHDISHLNTRRQRAREKENVQLTASFKKTSRFVHNARTGANSVKVMTTKDTEKRRRGVKKGL
jgi:hypothetical protein